MDDIRGSDNFHYSLLHADMWQRQPFLLILPHTPLVEVRQNTSFLAWSVLRDAMFKSSCFPVWLQATETTVRIWTDMAVMCNYSQVSPKRESPVWVIYVRDVHVITQCPSVLQNISLASIVSLHKLLCEATTKSINSILYWTRVKVYSS